MSLSRQVPLILAILGASALVSCAQPRQQPPPCPPCPPVSNNNSPIVIVNVVDNKAVPDPDKVHVNARIGIDKGRPVPAVVNWFGPADQTLRVAMKDPNQQCVRTEIRCNGDHCIAITNVNVTGASVTCQYRVWIEGVTQPYDPEVIVDNCCNTQR